MNRYVFTSESVCEGHPDKVCDYIADSILDAHIERQPDCHVACEVLVKDCHVILAGEIKCRGTVDVEAVTRQAIREIGYTDPANAFYAEGVRIQNLLGVQSEQIDRGVTGPPEQGAGDQGLMFGYATDETAELMPLPILLAHRLTHGLSEDRKSGRIAWLRPDGKTQVSVLYQDDRPVRVTAVVVSAHHAPGTPQPAIRDYVQQKLLPAQLGSWFHPDIRLLVNPTGEFSVGGPAADCGLTGRKNIVDTYGGAARHGGGSFSGKDPSKVDRSAAYFARYVARQIVKAGLARKVELQISYAIGHAEALSLHVNTLSTGDDQAACRYAEKYDFRPAAMIRQLDLLRPIYRHTTNFGHFGKTNLPWEQ
jgi:S-adenosylmethionine synthetase